MSLFYAPLDDVAARQNDGFSAETLFVMAKAAFDLASFRNGRRIGTLVMHRLGTFRSEMPGEG